MTEITLNGVAHQVTPGATLGDLIEALSLSGKAVAVAVNRNVVTRQHWHERGIQPGDSVDVVHAITGG